jgi:hypothetical protein
MNTLRGHHLFEFFLATASLASWLVLTGIGLRLSVIQGGRPCFTQDAAR